MITHYYQTTNFSCVQASAAMFLSYYGYTKTPADILKEVAVRSWPGKDEPAGTPNQDIAAYFCRLGFATEIISFDTWVTDLSWIGKDTQFIRERLEKASGKLTAPMIGREGTELYIQAYLDYIKAGGKVSVEAFAGVELINGLLADGPILTTVAYDTLHSEGKSINGPGLLTSRSDDLKGNSPNHNIVIGKTVDAGYEIYDSWKKPGVHVVASDRLIAAIATSQQECDNMLIVARPQAD